VYCLTITTDKWSDRKYRSWRRLLEDLEIGYLDTELLPLLVLVNRDVDLYTTSSCSGRVVVMDSEYPWEREETGIVFKTHNPIKPSDLEFIYSKPVYKRLWIVVSGPIIHIYSRSFKLASTILNTARRVGFKHSGVMHYSKDTGLFIELVTGIYIAQLARTRDEVIIEQTKIAKLVDVVNNTLLEGKKRLEALYVELSKILPRKTDPLIEGDLKTRGFQAIINPRSYSRLINNS